MGFISGLLDKFAALKRLTNVDAEEPSRPN
jgi:hypothetical protein